MRPPGRLCASLLPLLLLRLGDTGADAGDMPPACLSPGELTTRVSAEAAAAISALNLCVSEPEHVDEGRPQPIEPLVDVYDPCQAHAFSVDSASVELSFRHARGGAPVEAFRVMREEVGSDADAVAKEMELSQSELRKCRTKPMCTFADKVRPDGSYRYSLRAVNAAGEGDAAEIFCDVEAFRVTREDVGGAADEASHGDAMSVGTALLVCLCCSLVSAAVTAFFMYRSAWMLEQMTRREATHLDPRWLHAISRWFPYLLVLTLNVLWFSPVFGLFGQHLMLPALEGLKRKSRSFSPLTFENDLDGDGAISLAELQAQAQVPILADTLAEFRESKAEWLRKITNLNTGMRQEADELLDGDPVMQPQLTVVFVIGCVLFTYMCLLAHFSKDLWMAQEGEEVRSLQQMLEPKGGRPPRPGYAIGLFMLPLVIHQVWTSYDVISLAMGIARDMNRSIKDLNKIQQKLVELGKPQSDYNVLDHTFNNDGGKRWGIKMCGYAIDQKFWSKFLPNFMFVLGIVLVLVPFVMFAVSNLKSAKKAQAEEDKRMRSEVREEEHRAAKERADVKAAEAEEAKGRAERLREEADDMRKSEAERADLGERARQAEKQRRRAAEASEKILQESARLIDFTVQVEDLSVLDKDRKGRFHDWRNLTRHPHHNLISRDLADTCRLLVFAGKCMVNGEHLGKGKDFEAAGAAGEVFRASWKRQPVAIKRILDDSAMNLGLSHERLSKTMTTPQGRLKLNTEMKLFRELNHEHIVRSYGILTAQMKNKQGVMQEVNMIVTELCETPLSAFLGDDRYWMKDLRTKQHMTQKMIDQLKCDILIHVSGGLSRLHELNVLHKDIKSSNILLGAKDHQWKICDFGEARVLKHADDTVQQVDDKYTASIASPEIVNEGLVGLPSDVYAFAIVMWEVITRQEAWHWITASKKDLAILLEAGNNMRPVVPSGLGPDVRERIQMSMHHEPARRPTIKDLSDWLHLRLQETDESPHGDAQETGVPRIVEVSPQMHSDEVKIMVPGIVSCSQRGAHSEWSALEPTVPVAGCQFEMQRQHSAQSDNADNLTIRKVTLDASINPDEEEARWLFEQTDDDGNGSLDKDELRKLLFDADKTMTEKDLAMHFNEMDADSPEHNGQIRFQAFERWWVERKADDVLRRHVTSVRKSRQSLTLVVDERVGWKDSLKFRCIVKPGWLVGGKSGQNWNTLGKFIGVVGKKKDDWQEPALQGDEVWTDVVEDAEEQPGLFKTMLGEDSLGEGLGIVFKDNPSEGGTDTWPRVRRIAPDSLVGAATPDLRIGCKLMSINKESTDGMTFKDAAPMTKLRPLEFVWQDLLIEAEFTDEDGKLGVVFGDRWPYVKKIQDGTPGARIAELVADCKLLTINGAPVDGIPFKQAGPLVQERPLKLVFAKQREPAEPEPEPESALSVRFAEAAEPEPEAKLTYTASAPPPLADKSIPLRARGVSRSKTDLMAAAPGEGTIPVEPEPEPAL